MHLTTRSALEALELSHGDSSIGILVSFKPASSVKKSSVFKIDFQDAQDSDFCTLQV